MASLSPVLFSAQNIARWFAYAAFGLCALLHGDFVLAQPSSASAVVSKPVWRDVPVWSPVKPHQFALFGQLRSPTDDPSVGSVSLEPHAWAMVWVHAMDEVFVETSDHKPPLVQKISGPQTLRGILGFVEDFPTRVEGGRFRVFNPDPVPRAFLLGAGPKARRVHVQTRDQVYPDLQFSFGWRTLWQQLIPWLSKPSATEPPLQAHEEQPAMMALDTLLVQHRQLRTILPQDERFVTLWTKLGLVRWKERYRPASAVRRRDPIAPSSRRDPASWIQLSKGESLDFQAQGPGALELRSCLVQPLSADAEWAKLSLRDASLELGQLDLPPSRSTPPPQPESEPGCVRARKLVVPLGLDARSYALHHRGASTWVRVTLVQGDERWSDHRRDMTLRALSRKMHRLLARTEAKQPAKARLMRGLLSDVLAPKDRLAPNRALKAHDDLCALAPGPVCAADAVRLGARRDISRHARISRYEKACVSMKAQGDEARPRSQRRVDQALVAALSEHLQRAGALDLARQCLGPMATIDSAQAMAAQLQLSKGAPSGQVDKVLAAGHRWLVQRPQDAQVRRAYWDRWRTQSRWRSLRPARQVQDTRLRWLHPIAQTEPGRKTPHLWQSVEANTRYTVSAQHPDQDDRRHTLLRLALALPPDTRKRKPSSKATPVIVEIGPDRHRVDVDAKPRLFSWILSQNLHTLRVAGPSRLQAMIDLPIRYPSQIDASSYAIQALWPVPPGPQGQSFEIPQVDQTWPLAMTLRVGISGKAHGRQVTRLLLRDDRGRTRKIAVHVDSDFLDPALDLDDFGPSSHALQMGLGPAQKARKLTILAEGQGPKVAAAIRTRAGIERPSLPLLAQGPPAHTPLAQSIARADQYLQAGRWSDLRDELEWLLRQPKQKLMEHRAQIESHLDRLKLALHRPSMHYTPPHGERLSLRAAFLDQRTGVAAPTRKALIRQLQRAAQSLREHKLQAVGDAILAVQHYVEQEAGQAHQSQKGYLALSYGIMANIAQVLDGPVVSSLFGALARSSNWRSLSFAKNSAGFVRIQSPLADAQERRLEQWRLLSPPWGLRPDARWLDANLTHRFDIARPRAASFRLKAFCRDKVAGSNPSAPTNVYVEQGRSKLAKLEVHPGKLSQQDLSLYAGTRKLSIYARGPQDRRCACLLEEIIDKRPVPLPAFREQTWFEATPDDPVSFSVQGPGTMRVDLRGLLNRSTHATRAKLILKTPSGRRFEHKLDTSIQGDPQASLQDAPQLRLTQPATKALLLTEPGVHELQVQTPGPELMVLARTRQFDRLQTLPKHLAGLEAALLAKLAQPVSYQPIFASPKPLPNTQLKRRQPRPPFALYEMQGAVGIEQETDYEVVQSRWSTQVRGGLRKALVPHRLWAGVQARVASENWAPPTFSLQGQLWGQGPKRGLRVRVNASFHTQFLRQWARSMGVFARVDGSLTSLLPGIQRWDLRPRLSFVARHISKGANSIAQTWLAPALHAQIYRRYTFDHPLSLRPGLEFQGRPFYDLRWFLGQDAWSNADIQSLDRLRSWIRLWSLLDRYRGNANRWWTLGGMYRFTYALADEHRAEPFARHTLQADLALSWRTRRGLYWNLSLTDAVIMQGQGFAGNRLMMRLHLAKDGASPLLHRPFPSTAAARELSTRAYLVPEEQP